MHVCRQLLVLVASEIAGSHGCACFMTAYVLPVLMLVGPPLGLEVKDLARVACHRCF